MRSDQGKPENIEAYLASVPQETRRVLERLRKTIRSVVPEAEEGFSYGMPVFKLHGLLVGYAGWKTHCGFYVMSTSVMAHFKEELRDFETSAGTVRFTAEHPLPDDLVGRMLRMRIRENEEKRALKSARKPLKAQGTAKPARPARRARHSMPDFIRAALSAHHLTAAYDARPPYQRNDYIGWITQAKLEATQHKRLAQMLEELAKGDVYMKMEWRGKT